MTDIRKKLDTSIVQPLFGRVTSNIESPRVLPDVVLRNRRKRAHQRVLDALASRGNAKIAPESRRRLESIIEMWAAQDFDDAFQPIQDFEIRCARDHDLAAAMQSGDPRQLLALRESEYRQKVAERFGSIELRGIQVNHRVILDLEKVYVPLRAQELAPLVPGVVLAIDTKREIVEIIRERRHVVVFGDPGSGKSTLVSFLARLSAIGPNQTGWPDRILPFVITVRQIKEADLSPRWLANQSELDLAVVEAALSEQRVFLLVDGLDEAPESVRTQLVVSVARFVEDYPGVLVIVTSRPAGIAESLMVGLNGFSPSQLLDFSDDDVNEFIDKWCLAAEESARSDHAEAATQATAAASDLKARIARSGPVKRIAANPLLTTILCVVHRFLGRTIPEHRITLYEKCTDALLYEWDRAKFPKGATVGDLDANQKSVLLRRVASALHENHEAEMAEHETIRRFAAVLPQLGRPTEDASKIMHEIRDRTGVLVERRPGIFAFSHLTFQEYFTALDYAARPEQLINYVDDPWWHEVIALTAGAPGCDPRVIIRALLRRSDTESIILAAKCLETAINVPFDLRNKVEKAVERILPPRGFEDAQRLREIGLTVAPIIARNLAGYSVLDKSYSLSFFRGFDYDPVIPTLIQMADDNAATAVGGDAFVNLGEWAIIVLRNMATTSENAKRALFRVLSRSLSPDFLNLLRLDEIFGADFKLPPPEKRSSTRARNTASKLPNTPVRASR